MLGVAARTFEHKTSEKSSHHTTRWWYTTSRTRWVPLCQQHRITRKSITLCHTINANSTDQTWRRLKRLNLCSLDDKRLQAHTTQVFWTFNKLNNFDHEKFFERKKNVTTRPLTLKPIFPSNLVDTNWNKPLTKNVSRKINSVKIWDKMNNKKSHSSNCFHRRGVSTAPVHHHNHDFLITAATQLAAPRHCPCVITFLYNLFISFQLLCLLEYVYCCKVEHSPLLLYIVIYYYFSIFSLVIINMSLLVYVPETLNNWEAKFEKKKKIVREILTRAALWRPQVHGYEGVTSGGSVESYEFPATLRPSDLNWPMTRLIQAMKHRRPPHVHSPSQIWLSIWGCGGCPGYTYITGHVFSRFLFVCVMYTAARQVHGLC